MIVDMECKTCKTVREYIIDYNIIPEILCTKCKGKLNKVFSISTPTIIWRTDGHTQKEKT